MPNSPLYEIIVYWSEPDQAFVAEVPELPGCAAKKGRRAEVVVTPVARLSGRAVSRATNPNATRAA
jgi:hypothetical protein